MQRLSPRFRSMQPLLIQDMRINFLPKFYKHLFGDAMLVPIRMGINMAAGSQQKHLSLSFSAEAYIFLSRNSKHKNNTYSNTRTVPIVNSPKQVTFFGQHDTSRPSCKCRVTQNLRNSSVVYHKTESPFGAKRVRFFRKSKIGFLNPKES